jgi:hypothetical protein
VALPSCRFSSGQYVPMDLLMTNQNACGGSEASSLDVSGVSVVPRLLSWNDETMWGKDLGSCGCAPSINYAGQHPSGTRIRPSMEPWDWLAYAYAPPAFHGQTRDFSESRMREIRLLFLQLP